LSTTFSTAHRFTRAQIEEANAITKNQGAGHKLLVHVTTGHRQLVGRQFAVQQLAYWFTVIGMFFAELSAPHLSESDRKAWLIVSAISWLIRVALFLPVYYLPPAQVAKSIALKLCPLGIIIIACFYWVWTIELFAGPQISVRELFMLMGFLTISISMTGMWPVTPIAALIYNIVLWGAFSLGLYDNGLASIPVLVVLNLSVMVILGVNVYTTIRQVRTQMQRSDEVDLLNARLRTANREAEALKNAAYSALESRSAFFAEESHDFRQRLHGAKLMILAALADTSVQSPAHRTLKRLGEEIDSLEVFMNKILDFARIEAMDSHVQLRTCTLQSIFQKLDVHFEEKTRTTGKRLVFRNTRIKVGTDASMLQRMIENLISNALKFTRDGVLVGARMTERGLSIEIWDQGPGIRPEAQERIFDAFHQENPDDNVRERGIGLGLAIVKKFAERLNYKIYVHSVLGRGSVFKILIPTEFIAGTITRN
jgi:signal transduction histidine kinase